MKRAFLGMAIVSAFALTACSSQVEKKDQAMDQADQKLLTSYVWHLDRVSQPKATQESAASTAAEQSEALPTPPAEMRPFDISFDQERVSVQGLCNQLGGSYRVDGDAITISQMMSTRKLCSDEALMALENYVGQIMPAAEKWQVEGVDQAQLAQSTPTLDLLFTNGMRWQLEGTPTAETKYGQEAVIEFLQVDPQLQQCTDGQEDCLKVRKLSYDDQGIHTETGPWQLINKDQLEGYELDPNYRNIIRVKRFTEQGAEGEGRPIYIHDMTVETQPID